MRDRVGICEGRITGVSVGLVSSELCVVDGVASRKNGRKWRWLAKREESAGFKGAVMDVVNI